MRMRILWPAAAALLSLAPQAVAQTPATPEETARAFFAAMDAGRWDAVAALILPASAQRQRDLALFQAIVELEQATAAPGTGGTVVVSGSAAVDSAMLRRHGGHRIRPMRGAATLAEAAALEPREFLARFMESLAGPPGTAQTRTHQYIGVLVENDSVAHALFREHGGQPRDELDADVLDLRRSGGRWYVSLSSTFVRARLLDLPEGG